MTMETIFFIIGILIFACGLAIDLAKNISNDNPKSWQPLLIFFVAGIILEQIIVRCMGMSGNELICDSILSIWVFGIPLEILYTYFAFLYIIIMIYYGFVKDKAEEKLLSPF